MDARQAGLRSLECRSAGLRRFFDCRKASRFELEGSFTDIANHVHLSNPQPRIETTTTFSKITCARRPACCGYPTWQVSLRLEFLLMKLHQGSACAAIATMVGEGKRPSRPFAPVGLAFSSSIVSPRMLAIAVSSNVIIVLVTVSRYSRCANRSVSWTLLPWSLGSVSFC